MSLLTNIRKGRLRMVDVCGLEYGGIMRMQERIVDTLNRPDLVPIDVSPMFPIEENFIPDLWTEFAVPPFDLTWFEMRSPGTGVSGYLVEVLGRARPMEPRPRKGEQVDLEALERRRESEFEQAAIEYGIACDLSPRAAAQTSIIYQVYAIEHGPERPTEAHLMGARVVFLDHNGCTIPEEVEFEYEPFVSRTSEEPPIHKNYLPAFSLELYDYHPHPALLDPPPEDEWRWLGDMVALQHTLMFFSLMNAKNISLRTVDGPRGVVCRGKAPRGVQWKRLHIKVPGEFSAGTAWTTLGGEMSRAHLVRGHFATYTEDAPAFGKPWGVGRFWVPAHARGDEGKGATVKEYVLGRRRHDH